MYIHENNINTKIRIDYKQCGAEILNFKNKFYLPMRNEMEGLDFTSDRIVFNQASNILNNYWQHLHEFAHKYKIQSQSKFESTFLEEINSYLFHNLPIIKNGQLNIFNKGIYAGLKFKEDLSIDIIKKDVDFCIGKKVALRINEQEAISLIIPAISVEVKTYLDATMFGEIKSSSKTLKSATPNSKAYVLMGYKCLADEHILAARQDSILDEMFVLQANEGAPLDATALYDYYREIAHTLQNLTTTPTIQVPGRLLTPIETLSH